MVLGVVPKALEGFPEGPHVHEKDGRLEIAAGALLGQHGLLDGHHAADVRTKIGVQLHVAGAHTLDPGNLADRPPVAQTHEAPARRAGAAQKALEFDLGQDVGFDPVAEGVLAGSRVVEVRPAAEHHRPGLDLPGLGGLELPVDLHHLGQKAVHLEGLDEVVHRADLHGRHRGFHRGVGGHHDHGQVRRPALGEFEHLHSVHTRHFDVQQHEVEGPGFEDGQRVCAGCGHGHCVPLFFEPFLQGVAHHQFIVHYQNAEFFALRLRHANGIRGADLGTGPAARAGRRVDDVGVGGVVGHRQVNGLARRQAGVEAVANLHRTDRHAAAATDAAPRIHPGGLLFERHPKRARIPLDGGDLRGEQNVDVLVKQPPAQAMLRCGVALDQWQHLAHAAVIRGKLVVELAQDAADVRRPIHQGDPVAVFSQVQSSPNSGDPGADHHGGANSAFHPIPSPGPSRKRSGPVIGISRRPTAG